MTPEQFDVAMQVMAQQRNTALDACVQLQVQIHALQMDVAALQMDLSALRCKASPEPPGSSPGAA